MSEFVEGDLDEVSQLVIDGSRVPAGRQLPTPTPWPTTPPSGSVLHPVVSPIGW